MKPTLYLSNWSSARTPGQHGPGRKLCAMAAPLHWCRGTGRVLACAPFLSDLRRVQRDGDMAHYRSTLEACFASFAAKGMLGDWSGRTAGLVYDNGEVPGGIPVEDGDTLFCTCARPGSPKRKHSCHLEVLAPFLLRAGWDVVLWGVRIGADFDPCSLGWPHA